MHLSRGLAITGVVLTLGLIASGCGSGAPATPSTPNSSSTDQGAFNNTDVRFTQKMLPHHMQAVRNAQIELDSGSAPEVKALAQSILDAQQKEVATMQGFLRTFGAPTMSAPADQQAIWDKNTNDLRSAATPQQRDVVFLTNMVPHHAAAIPMAQEEVDLGKYAAAQDLAKSIIQSQRMQIVDMNNMIRARTST